MCVESVSRVTQCSTLIDNFMQGISGVEFDQTGGYYSIRGGCASLSSLPDIAFVVGGQTYTLPPVQWTQSVSHLPIPVYFCCSAKPIAEGFRGH